MHRGHREIAFNHFLSQPFDSLSFIAKYNCLSDSEGIVEIAECLKLVAFLLNRHKELLDLVKSELISRHQNPYRFVHELVGHL